MQTLDSVDGYSLFEQLRYGETVLLDSGTDIFKLKFEGQFVGHSSSLVVVNTSGQTRSYSPGFDHPCVFHALDEIALGWQHPQTHLPRPVLQ